MIEKQIKRLRRHNRVRARVSGTIAKPRLCVFRSNTHIYAQLIDDVANKIILQAKDTEIKTGTKVEKADKVGQAIAKLALEKKIKEVVFDRGGYKYHGRVKSLAEGARKGGLKF